LFVFLFWYGPSDGVRLRGFASEYLPKVAPVLDSVIIDNETFPSTLCQHYGYPRELLTCVGGSRLDCREDVSECEAHITQPRRAHGAPPTDVDRVPRLGDPLLILEEEADALAFMSFLNFSETGLPRGPYYRLVFFQNHDVSSFSGCTHLLSHKIATLHCIDDLINKSAHGSVLHCCCQMRSNVSVQHVIKSQTLYSIG
jgi:hypothetical protein